MEILKPIHQHFTSVSALIDECSQPWDQAANHKHYDNHFVTGQGNTKSWYGISGGVNAVHSTLTDSWPDGKVSSEKLLADIAADLPSPVGIGRKLYKGDAGDHLDIHAVNRGDLSRAWSGKRRQLKKGKSTISLFVDICGSGVIDARVLRWRGIAAVALTRLLVKAGYKIEIIAAIGQNNYLAHGSAIPMLTTIGIKSFSNYLDVDYLSATIVLPGFFRVYGFAAVIKAVDRQNKIVDAGLGTPFSAESLIGQIEINSKTTQLIVPNSIRDRLSSVEWLNKTVALLQSIHGVQ